jgi:DNA excision repair protein ERCC-4
MKILIDSREQLPYRFDTPSVVGTIPTGDYSIEGLEDRIAVERKEINDLVQCLSKHRERFEKELQRGRGLHYFAVVIEGSLADITNGRYRSLMKAQAALQSLIAFSIRYRLPIWFCGTRQEAQQVTESLLIKYSREIEKAHQYVNG